MNIITMPLNGSSCCCRPDTTWERENRDFYSPDCINEIYWTPVIFARISKAGKCISRKFAPRYYDAVGYGMLMYCRRDGVTETAFTSCIDHSSILPFPLYNPVVLENEDNRYEVRKDDMVIFSTACTGTAQIEYAISRASETTSLRIGDFVALELSCQEPLTKKTEGPNHMKGAFCNNEVFDFNIIF